MGAVAAQLFRPGLLDGVSLWLARISDGPHLEGLGAACSELGANVTVCEAQDTDEEALDRVVGELMASAAIPDILVIDARSLFAGCDGKAQDLLRCMRSTWNVTRAVVNNAFLPAGEGGRIVFLAPGADAGAYAQAARAGICNLGRTLSVEWARHGINTVTVAPDAQTPAGQIVTLTMYLASPAGAYFSGCVLDLRGEEL
jgi:NAD(P)-dependent dehydrogenase (short-subunit alcohol dehydrogenase family)